MSKNKKNKPEYQEKKPEVKKEILPEKVIKNINISDLKCRRCLKLVDPDLEIVEQGLCSDCLVRVGLLVENKRF
jgi:hypothetical protein